MNASIRNTIPALRSLDGGSGTFRLKAFYYTWDKAHMDPGDGNATARFTIMQE